MKPRFAIRNALLLGGIGFGMLAAVFLITLGWLSPRAELRQGPLVPTATDSSLPPPTSSQPSPPPTSAQPPPPSPVPPTYPILGPTIVAGVPALPPPVPTDVPVGGRPPFCAGSDPYPVPCTPIPATPTPQQVPFSPTPDSSTAPWETGHGDFGLWNYDYTYYPSEAEVWATVHYDASSVDSIQAYTAANRTLAAEVAQTVGGARVDITFRTYMPLSQLHDWALGHGLYNGWIGLRFVNPAGATADYVLPLVYSFAPSLMLPVQYVSPQGQEGQYRIDGVFYLSGMVDVQRLPEIVADPLVFLADVTPNIVRTDLMSKRPIPPLPGLSWVTIQPASPFRRMEELGLERFR